MTPHEKAFAAINARLERLQANLREAKEQAAQQFLAQSLVVSIGIAEALNGYGLMVGKHAKRRHAEVKRSNGALEAQHADLLKAGQELLEKFKASPTDRGIRKEIDRLQHEMTALQKNVSRGAHDLQRELALSLAALDPMSVNVRKLCEAEQSDALKRALTLAADEVAELYARQPSLPSKRIIDGAAWEKSAAAEIDLAVDFRDAYARAGYQMMLALELMSLTVSENPPGTTEEALLRANQAAGERLKEIAARVAGKGP